MGGQTPLTPLSLLHQILPKPPAPHLNPRSPQTERRPPAPILGKAFVGVKQKSNTFLTAGNVGAPSGLSLWFPPGDYTLGSSEKASPIIPPVPRLTKPDPTPAGTSKPLPPPNRHVSPENRGHFPPHLPQLLSPEILVPYFEGSKIWGASLTFGVQEKGAAPVASLASFLSAGSGSGECPREGGPPTRELRRGFLHSQSELGTPPQTRPSPSVSNSAGEAAAMPQSDSPNTTFLTPSRGVPGPPKNPQKI